jgi:large subunit ribosomal protein L25
METIQLEAQTRDLNIKPSQIRKTKLVPGVFYGKNLQPVSLQMPYGIFRKILIKAGTNRVIELHIDGKKKENVLVHDVQFYPLTGQISHVDFLAVNLTEEVTANVPVEITGVSPAVKDLGGILTTVKHEIEVKCLPMEIPQSIVVDISVITDFAHAIHVKDLQLPSKVKVLDDAEEVVITVSAPRAEEEVVAPVSAGLEGTAAEVAAKEEAEKAAAAAAEGGAKDKEK